jgi:hypothetical protein
VQGCPPLLQAARYLAGELEEGPVANVAQLVFRVRDARTKREMKKGPMH